MYPSKVSQVENQSQSQAQVQGTSDTNTQPQDVSPAPAVNGINQKTSNLKSSPSPSPKQSQQTQSSTQNTQQHQSPSPSTAAGQSQQPTPTTNTSNQTFQITLKVNGSTAGDVNVPSGSNQCDVLTKALDQGKISSLNMKYDNNYGSYAVYQINGIGNPSSVWWGYKVNGQSPSKGCSYISANSGEVIEWDYAGS